MDFESPGLGVKERAHADAPGAGDLGEPVPDRSLTLIVVMDTSRKYPPVFLSGLRLRADWRSAAIEALRRYRESDPRGWADYLVEADHLAGAGAPIADEW